MQALGLAEVIEGLVEDKEERHQRRAGLFTCCASELVYRDGQHDCQKVAGLSGRHLPAAVDQRVVNRLNTFDMPGAALLHPGAGNLSNETLQREGALGDHHVGERRCSF